MPWPFTIRPKRKAGIPTASCSALTAFKDHFSCHAEHYAKYRPAYPASLYRYLAAACERHALAWDAATGNGQAARGVARHFDKVVATDASRRQIDAALKTTGIEFRVATAEESGLDSGSVDLITVAQALHWFDIDRFLTEACRVLKPAGVLAFWCYEFCAVDERCDPIIGEVFAAIAEYWPPERAMVGEPYRSLAAPMPDLEAPQFEMHAHWRVEELLGYFSTWSASRRYMADRGADPLATFAAPLRAAWGAGRRRVTWPLTVRAVCNNA